MSGVSDTQRVNQPGREEALVRADEHPIEHESPEDWGWHAEMGKFGRIGAVIATLVLLTFLIGNHQGHVEDLWILALALIMILIMIADWRRRRNAWRSR
jgi:hypothetical protein